MDAATELEVAPGVEAEAAAEGLTHRGEGPLDEWLNRQSKLFRSKHRLMIRIAYTVAVIGVLASVTDTAVVQLEYTIFRITGLNEFWRTVLSITSPTVGSSLLIQFFLGAYLSAAATLAFSFPEELHITSPPQSTYSVLRRRVRRSAYYWMIVLRGIPAALLPFTFPVNGDFWFFVLFHLSMIGTYVAMSTFGAEVTATLRLIKPDRLIALTFAIQILIAFMIVVLPQLVLVPFILNDPGLDIERIGIIVGFFEIVVLMSATLVLQRVTLRPSTNPAILEGRA